MFIPRITQTVRAGILACTVASIIGVAPHARAQCEFDKLLTGDGETKDYFGYTVAMSGDRAVIGAYGGDDYGSNSGSAYVFRFDGAGWVEEAKLIPLDGETFDYFGWSVAISGEVVVVGAPKDDDQGEDAGAAYVFRFQDPAWVQEAKLVAADGETLDDFGHAVAVAGDTAVIGAPLEDALGDRAGAAYVFRYSAPDWSQEQKLLAVSGEPFDYFGDAVATSAGTIMVGAYGDDDNSSSAGAVYTLVHNGATWEHQSKLLAGDGQGFDFFGCAIEVAGDVAIIGASGDDDRGLAAGSAYVFRFNSMAWVQEGKLLASDGAANDEFGESVAIDGDCAVVGASSTDDLGDRSGSAYVFRFDQAQWTQEVELLASDGAPSDWFGSSVAVIGDVALVGAYGDDDNGGISGATYAFDLAGGTDCNENGVCDPRDIAQGTCVDLNENSIPDDCECPGDLTGDWVVGLHDLAQLIGHYGATSAVYTDGDLDLDDDVDLYDLAELMGRYGDTCP
jgi:hypothetical protein